MSDDDPLSIYLASELRRRGYGWVKWIIASLLTMVGSAVGAGYAAGKYVEEIRQRSSHAEYVAEEARACCLRQTDRINTIKEKQ
jgi:hypothetical protein